MKISTSAGLAGIARRADPVDRLAARIDLLDHSLTAVAAPKPGDQAWQRVGIGTVGDVDVQQKWRATQATGQHLLHHAAHQAAGGLKLDPALGDL